MEVKPAERAEPWRSAARPSREDAAAQKMAGGGFCAYLLFPVVCSTQPTEFALRLSETTPAGIVPWFTRVFTA